MPLFSPFCRLTRRQQWDIHAIRSALATALLLLAAAPALAQDAVISHAEQPSRLIRKTTIHQAPAGVRLQSGDIVESGARPVQIEWSNGVRLALGPASSVLVNDAGGAPSASLLRGWSKFATTAPVGKQLAFDAGLLSLRAAGASGIVRLASDKTELFVESGVVPVTDTGPGGGRRVEVGREQYAARSATLPLAVAPRAPRLFIEQLPRAFLDPLVAVARRAPATLPTPQREIATADIVAWNDAGPAARKRLASQFATRLADATFRNEAEDVLATLPEWRDALRRQRAAKVRATAPLNHLF